jgi:heat shock protein HslJ
MKRSCLKVILIFFIGVGFLTVGCAKMNIAEKTEETKPPKGEAYQAPAPVPESRESSIMVCGKMPDGVYTIDGEKITLLGGVLEKTIPGSSAKVVTRYFGNEVQGDFNRDGKEDIAFILTQEKGGSGTFYYLAVALCANNGHQGTNALLLGDRIAPQSTMLDENDPEVIIVSYAKRMADEPMTAQPSIMVSRAAKILNGELIEIAHDFPGEANPKVMTLDMKTWMWVYAAYADGKRVEPKKAGAFRLTFNSSGQVSVMTDCNSMIGPYSAKDGKLTFGNFAATKMYCEGSQENDFSKMLGEVSSFFFNSRGELIMGFKYDSGSMIFK